jgi:non-heme chloroperoxidase
MPSATVETVDEVRKFRGAEGIALAAHVCGNPHSQPVVLLHGGGQTRHAWGALARELAGLGWHVISMDLRGHGESDWSPSGDYTIDALTEDLASVAAALDRPPVFVGASLGGLTSLATIGERPEVKARALILVDITVNPNPDGVARISSFMRARPDGFESVEEAADAIAEYLPHRPRPKDTKGLRKNLRRGEDGRYRWHWDPAMLEGKGRIGLPRDRLEAAARAVRVPTLLLRGDQSEVVSADGVEDFRKLVPHAEAAVVPKAKHMVAGDENDLFCAAIVSFLWKNAPPAPSPKQD